MLLPIELFHVCVPDPHRATWSDIRGARRGGRDGSRDARAGRRSSERREIVL